MPVLLDDEMLIPPSMRRKNYVKADSVYEVSDSSSVIELPPHTRIIEPHSSRLHNPVVIHQERYVSGPPVSEVAIVREKEYIIDSGGSRGGNRHYRGRAPYEEMDIRRGRRARSVGYHSYDDSSSGDERESYYLDDSASSSSFGRRRRHGRHADGSAYGGGERRTSRYSSPERHGHRFVDASHRDSSHQHGNNHHHLRRNVAEVAGAAAAVGLAGTAVHKLRRRSSSTSSVSGSDDGRHHVLRNTAIAGVAAEGGRRLYKHHKDHHQYDQQSGGHSDHRARHAAEAGLGVTALGAARDHHKRRESPHHSQRRDDHSGRHLATAALGATAAGLAAHKYTHHTHSSEGDPDQHRGRKVAAGLATATAAGIAAKHYYGQHEHHHRSRSSSSSSTGSDKHGYRHKLRNTAIGLGAAELAHRVHKKRNSRSRSRPGILRRRSRSSSDDEHGRKIRNAALGLGALGAAEVARRHHKHKQSRSRSRPGILRRRSSSVSFSSDSSSYRSGSRSHSRPGILRRRSKSLSLPHSGSRSHESTSHPESTSMRGALSKGEGHHRSRSADRRHEDSGNNHGAAAVGRIMSEAVIGALGGSHSQKRRPSHSGPKETLIRGVAYKVGETVAENMLKKRAGH